MIINNFCLFFQHNEELIPNYLVVDTDYTTYTTVYNCREPLGETFEIGWILTRETNPPQEVVSVSPLARGLKDVQGCLLLLFPHRLTRAWLPSQQMDFQPTNSSPSLKVPMVLALTRFLREAALKN